MLFGADSRPVNSSVRPLTVCEIGGLKTAMKIYGAFLTGRIYWKIHRDDPVTHSLQSLPGWFLINPLSYPQIELQYKIGAKPIMVINDTAIIQSDGIMLGTNLKQFDISSIPFPIEPPQITKLDPHNPENDIFDITATYIEHLAASLRQSSKQVTVPIIFTHGFHGEIQEFPESSYPEFDTNSGFGLQQYLWDTAVTWKDINDADVNLINQKPPVYERLMLDAIHAFRDKDYRRSLLYAAIAVETALATKLDETYELVIQVGDSKGTLRVISISQSAGTPVVKDPVYEFLFDKSRFAERLHEVSLYLTGKSLLLDDEALYQKTIKLYRTRNKIAHLGEPPTSGQSTFGMNEKDSLEVIKIAIKVFEWLGVQTKIHLPRFGFVMGYSPKEGENL
jgi:hypothetical protein